MSDVLDSEIEDNKPEIEEVSIDLIIEDGSCVNGANSYITLEEANGYMLYRNRTDWLSLSDIEKKSSIIKATQYVDSIFRWKGRRKYIPQLLAFPRVKIKDYDGLEVKGIPLKLKEAICEAAYYGYKTELFATYDTNGAIKKQRVEGAVEVEYFNENETEVNYVSKYASLNSLLRGLYIPKNARRMVSVKCVWEG